MLLVKNCDLMNMAGIENENYDVLMDGGKFVKVAKNIEAPEGCQVIDAAGRLVTPGLIETHCHLGMASESGSNTNERGNPNLPALRAIDALEFDALPIRQALQTGVTTICTGPGSANIIGGTFAALKTCWQNPEEQVMVEELAMKMAFGENPKLNYGRKGKTPATRMGCAATLRDILFKTKAYHEKWLAHQEKLAKGEASTFNYDAPMHSLMRVFEGMICKIHCHEAADILAAIRIAKEFNLNYSIEHTTEGALIMDELKAEGGKYIVGPTMGGASKAELRFKRYDTQGKLEKAGIRFAITTDSGVIPIEHILTQLCVLVKYGLSKKGALKGVTCDAAWAVGLDDRIGTIEEGKDADLVIWDVHPLETDGKAGVVVIGGKVRYEAEKEEA